MEPSDAKRLNALEDEYGRLQKLLAEQMLDNAMLRDINSKNGDARRKAEAVVQLMELFQVNQRRACDGLQIDRSTVRYLSRRSVDVDVDLRDAIKRVSRGFCRKVSLSFSITLNLPYVDQKKLQAGRTKYGH